MKQDELLENGEVILEKVRKHWIVYIQDAVSHIFGCSMFILAASFLSSRGTFSFIDSDTSTYTGMILIMFVIIFWTSFFYAWTKNYFDVWYITDKHIIAVNQKQMFEREEAFMELTRIQDVLFDKNGLLSTWLGYGKLRIQSAGEEQEFVIENVHDVEAVAHRIMGLRDMAKKGNNGEVVNVL